jgi:hypothetical protein
MLISKEVAERSLGEQPEDGHQRPQGWVEARQAASALYAVKRGRFATAKAAEYHLKIRQCREICQDTAMTNQLASPLVTVHVPAESS